jgi:hypothetical protein
VVASPENIPTLMMSARSRDKRRFPFLKMVSSFDFGQKEKTHRHDEPSLSAFSVLRYFVMRTQ